MVNFIVISGLISIVLIIAFIVIYFGYRSRKAPILKVLGSTYFRFEILSPARKLLIVNRMAKDFKIFGSVILFDAPGGRYKVMDERVFLRESIPTSLYKFGNPIPLNIYDHPDPDIVVWDEDGKAFVKNRMSAQELKEATDSKVVSDLNKAVFSRIELVMVVIGVLGIIVNIIVLYEIVNVASQYGTLVNELNQILKSLPTTGAT